MFVRWWRIGEQNRRRVWLLYPWFTGLMCSGSCFGVMSACGRMMHVVSFFFANRIASSTAPQPGDDSDMLSLFSTDWRWLVAYNVTYPIEFFCMSIAKLMVLDKMLDFAVPRGSDMATHVARAGRLVMSSVVVGNVAGTGSSFAAAVYWREASNLAAAAAVALATNSSVSESLRALAFDREHLVTAAESAQQFSEVAVLLLIIATFAVAGIACARRVSSALQRMDDEHGAAGRQLRRQIVITVAVVIVTFLLRAAYATMFAFGAALQNEGEPCRSAASPCDAACLNIYLLMLNRFNFTPEFQATIITISSPLTLLVALWGMTTPLMLQMMSDSGRQLEAFVMKTKTRHRQEDEVDEAVQ